MMVQRPRAEQVLYPIAHTDYKSIQGAEVEAVVRGAAGRLALLYSPTYSPWLNPIEMLWQQFRREVTHVVAVEVTHPFLPVSA